MDIQHEELQDNKEVVLSVQGMSCSACATRIERSLLRLPGVEEAAVSYPLRTAWIQRTSTIDLPSLLAKIEKLGFKAHIHQSTIADMKEEKVQLQRRLLWAIIFALPLLCSMLQHFPWLHPLVSQLPQWLFAPWLQLLLATFVQFVIGLPFYISAYHAIRERLANMDVLVAMGTTAAYIYSHYEVFRNGLDGLLQYASYEQAALYFESSAVVITAVLLGKYIELNASLKLQQEHDAFTTLDLSECIVERDGILEQVATHFVKEGDIVHVSEKTYIPIDGVVQGGEAYVEEALLTGEHGLISKQIGDRVWAGTYQSQGTLRIMTTAAGHHTLLNKIQQLVRQGQRSKTSIQRYIDKVIRWFVPCIITVSIATLCYWWLWGTTGSMVDGLLSSLAVLLVACPCALGLAAPISLAITSSRLVKHGLIVKEASVLEGLAEVNAVVFDKTGTLTEGRLRISYMKSMLRSNAHLLSIVAALEKNEDHPIARAIHEAVRHDEKLSNKTFTRNIESFAGKGVMGYVNEQPCIVGNEKMLSEQGVKLTSYMSQAATERLKLGESVIYCVQNNSCVGFIALSDSLKESAKQSIAKLSGMEVHPIMATGDHHAPANRVAAEVGITETYTNLLPGQKLELIQQLQKNGSTIAMVGDGWNDAPALAGANVGIAMSNSTEAALHAGHMTLLYSQLHSIPLAIGMSRLTLRNIKQNLWFAFIYNSIMIPVASLGFLQPWMAGVAMALSSICVVFNALSLHYRLNRVEKVGAPT